MKVGVLILSFSCLTLAIDYDSLSTGKTRAIARAQQHSNARRKREVVGALDIVTNNAQPIHAEVKPENGEAAGKKCFHTNRKHVPSKIEPGVVFQVTPPKAGLYEVKSLRKSLPLNSKLDLIRGINRLITLSVLAASAIFEFYPVIKQACERIIDILYST